MLMLLLVLVLVPQQGHLQLLEALAEPLLPFRHLSLVPLPGQRRRALVPAAQLALLSQLGLERECKLGGSAGARLRGRVGHNNNSGTGSSVMGRGPWWYSWSR
jgi:hypothetical protein